MPNLTRNKVSYIDRGIGTPLLFLHGNPDTKEMWNGSIDFFSKNYRCIAPDLPGFGDSFIADDFSCSLLEYSGWLDTFIEDIGLQDPVHLIVHDLGGPVGLSWAVKHQAKVISICVTNSLYFSDYRWHFWGRVWRTPLIGEISNLLMSRWIYNMEMRRSGPRLPEEHKNMTYQNISDVMKSTILRMYRAFSPNKFGGWEDDYLLLTQAKPVIVIWGAQDPYIPMSFGFAKRFAQNHECHIIDNSGHWVSVDANDEFNHLLNSFYITL